MKKYAKGIVVVILITVAAISMMPVISFINEVHQSETVNKRVKDTIKNKENDMMFSQNDWDDLKKINNDFVGYLIFPDEWIMEPIVQGEDNDYYLHHDFEKNINDLGTVYMDSSNELFDQNISIYGHNVFMPGELKFTRISHLVNQAVYDKHHNFDIYWKDHVSRYVITNVYYYDAIMDKDFPFYEYNIPEEEFASYKNYIDTYNLISPVDELREDDNFVSLVTCKALDEITRIIVVAREERRVNY